MQVKQMEQAASLSEYIQAIKTNSDTEHDEWLSPSMIAQELGMHINSIYKIIRNSELVSYNLVTGKTYRTYYRIKRSDLENWLADRRTKYIR